MFPDNFVKMRAPVKNRRAKVSYSYVAENTDEFTLEPGQVC